LSQKLCSWQWFRTPLEDLQAHNTLWEGGYVDDPCWWAAIPIVFSSIVIESIKIWVHVFMCISILSYVWRHW
jgi:hypothetical protein